MNIWIAWLLFLGLSIILLILTDAIKKRSHQRMLAVAASILLITNTALTILLPTEYWEIVLLITGQIFFIIIALRLLFSRRLGSPHATARDAWQLAIIMAASVGIVFLAQNILLWVLLSTIAFATFMMLIQLRDGISKYTLKKVLPQDIDDLPTVSVCIPARNETYALAACLSSILESDYPKLEVIVLDDCSQDQTSRIIHSFAHAGVRFVQGEAPSDGWLGRNQALHVLMKEATGKYLLFMGVDTRLSPTSISQLIEYTREKHLSMVSVLPRRAGRFDLGTVLSPLRYFWQLTTPRFVDMPVASSLWLIQAHALENMNGLKDVPNIIEPERTFAQKLATKHTYRFLIGNRTLGIYNAKKWSSQIETSVRMWYPLLNMQPARVLLAMFGQYLFIYLPYIIVISSVFTQQYGAAVLLSAAIISLQFAAYGIYIFRTQKRGKLLAILCLPFVALQETALILTSFIQYEFGTVDWKGRNVCYPILSFRPLRS